MASLLPRGVVHWDGKPDPCGARGQRRCDRAEENHDTEFHGAKLAMLSPLHMNLHISIAQVLLFSTFFIVVLLLLLLLSPASWFSLLS